MHCAQLVEQIHVSSPRVPDRPFGDRRWYVTHAGLLIPRYILTVTFSQVSWDLPSLASLRFAILRKAHISWSGIIVPEKKQGELLEPKVWEQVSLDYR